MATPHEEKYPLQADENAPSDPFVKPVEQKAPEQSQIVPRHEQLFNDFKSQVTAPEPSTLETHQQSRAPTLGAAGRKPNLADLGGPNQQTEATQPNAEVKMPHLGAQQEASIEHLKGARIMDLQTHNLGPKPELTNGEKFNLETTRRVAAGMRPSLSEQMVATGHGPKPAPEQETQQGEKGRGEGGKERPSDPSFYTGATVGGIAIPERDTKGAEIAAARRRVDRSRGRGGMGL
jgi:hypothetical protein